MKKEIFNLKLELFKNTVQDYQISKKGNHWGYLNKRKENSQYQIQNYNVTKSNINKLFKTFDYQQDLSTILMMTPRGKLFIKSHNTKSFKAVTIRTCPDNLVKLFLFGRKAEWICNYSNLIQIKFLHSFKSLNEVKIYLGYSFISDKEFIKLLDISFISFVIYSKLLTHDDRINLLHHGKNLLLMDAIQMSIQLNLPISIPESKEKLKIWHDDLVSKKNSEKASRYSDEQIQYKSWLFDYWKSKGVEYKILDSPRKLFLQGCKQNHCLASYSNQMSKHMYITFTHDNKEYDMQIHNTTGLIQFYGYRNQRPPQELMDLVKFEKLQDYYFTITNPNTALSSAKFNDCILEENWF